MTSLNSLLHLPVPLVLASQSPRRQRLLRDLGFVFDVVVPEVDEDAVVPQAPFHTYVTTLAMLKARRGAELMPGEKIVIGSDTTVVFGQTVLNKPTDAVHAQQMLRELSGKTHVVHTGLALSAYINGVAYETTQARATEVTFRELEDDEIEAYVRGGSPLDKAGAYGIQDDFGAVFVSKVNGCYYTVVGLPLELLYTSLRDLVRSLQ